ncbi:unnamed protein product [Caenorhabditis angaria]|uniref:Prospero domain-containing protein n=1 Tax=Caenorhabditis angaria TaxID=860376 RepID=A0A9P1IG37_9PELO|nr:unnamed protein product [Caenorhabditis angaria]
MIFYVIGTVKSRNSTATTSSSSTSSTTTILSQPPQIPNLLQLNLESLWPKINNISSEETSIEQEEIEEEKSGQETEEEEEEGARSTPSSTSGTGSDPSGSRSEQGSGKSKRKSFQPKKLEPDQEEEEEEDVSCGEETTQQQQQQTNQNNSFLEAHRKIYSAFLEQQRSRIIGNLAQQQKGDQVDQQQNKKEMNVEQLVESLKSEIYDNMQEKKPASKPMLPPGVPPIFHHPMFAALAAAQNNQIFGAPQQAIGGGIFPPFNAFQAFQNAMLRRNLENEEPRKKRMKLEPFPPTMVGHPMFGTDRENSPSNSDDGDFGCYDGCGNGGGGANSTLTPMHLRKAKLMFFYTRYPNSNLLKSYFPDIRFNKNNTAQLVKWFSNFREFYYIQMEKFGRQLLAEGVRSRDEIYVTKDSELFKVLNTHYNRNNHIKAPDNLLFVVQETLREFYDAIRLGKDVEPSWKKTIYKIINRMDDQIPEFFKEPNFLDRLEG